MQKNDSGVNNNLYLFYYFFFHCQAERSRSLKNKLIIMPSKKRFDLTINHKQPDKLVVDFGATSVSGIHVSSVEKLREYYGLEKRLVKVVDPYQMLGEVDSDLIEIMGVDTIPAKGRKNSFGFTQLPKKLEKRCCDCAIFLQKMVDLCLTQFIIFRQMFR